jgi:F420-0:gamma-glutamyl ligase-like protein
MIGRLLNALIRRATGLDLAAMVASTDETCAALEAGELEGWGFAPVDR